MPVCAARDAVHVVYVARGNAPVLPIILSVEKVLRWSASPSRLCFHVLAGEYSLADAVRISNQRSIGRLQIHNATDGALRAQLSDLGRLWLHHSSLHLKVLPGAYKNHQFTVPKLFLHEILNDVPHALLLDTDTVVMGCVCQLWDKLTERLGAEPLAVLAYAAEQQNIYRKGMWQALKLVDVGSDRSAWSGYNGGVGFQALGRMRKQPAFRMLLRNATLVEPHKFERIGAHLAFDRSHQGKRSRSHMHVVSIIMVSSACLPCRRQQLLACVPTPRFHFISGDQSIFTWMSSSHPILWRKLAFTLDCEWNWQLCLHWYAESRAERKLNSICPRAPKLLHANCPETLKRALWKLDMGARSMAALLYNRNILETAFQTPELAHMCTKAEERLPKPSVFATACNATFLLLRYAAAVQ